MRAEEAEETAAVKAKRAIAKRIVNEGCKKVKGKQGVLNYSNSRG
jgi:hypothetical protein